MNTKDDKAASDEQTKTKYIFTFNPSFSEFISFRITDGIQRVSCLIDTQAEISLLKENVLNKNLCIDRTVKTGLRGIADSLVFTMGVVHTFIHFGDLRVPHTFHVVSNKFPIPVDCLLGKDFIHTHKSVLNYDNMTFSFAYDQCKINIKFSNNPYNTDTIVLPANCMIARRFKFKQFSQPQYVEEQELLPGVYTEPCIVNDNLAYIQVINTTNKTQIVPNNRLVSENIENYEVNRFKQNEIINSKRRIENLTNILKKQIPVEYADLVLPLCLEYSDIFSLETDSPTVNNFYTEKLVLKQNDVYCSKIYQHPYWQRETIRKQIQKLLDDKIIEPCVSNFNSPLLLLAKKGSDESDIKNYRVVIDMSGVNNLMVKDKFPLPSIDSIIHGLGKGQQFFSRIDLRSSFFQVPLEEGSRHITAFATESKQYQFRVMPMGCSNSPSPFSRLISIALSKIPRDVCFAYIDDVLVVARPKEQHIANIRTVFKVFRDRNLKMNPKKCEFFKDKISFCGHICSKEGISPDMGRYDKILKWQSPKTKDECKKFVATANFLRRYIKGFSQRARCLNKLTRQDVPFIWTDEHQAAFDYLKNALVKPPVLQYPDFNKTFILTCDASKDGAGAVLAQLNEYGDEMPVAYFSKAFNDADSHREVIYQELLAIYLAVENFRIFLFGKHFIIKTDHRSLTFHFRMKKPTSKIIRIRLALEEYDFSLYYLPGRLNHMADALSRLSIKDLKQMRIESENEKNIFRVTTRSMSRKQKEIEKDPKILNNDEITNKQNTYRPMVYDSFSPIFSKNTARIKNEIIIVDENTKILKIYAHLHRKIIFKLEFKIDNDVLDLNKILSLLEQTAVKNKIFVAEWLKDENIFTLIKINEFKEHANKVLKNLELILIEPVRKIIDVDEQKRLVEVHHNDKIIGGHVGKKKTYYKLRSNFYWPKMARDVSRFVENCEVCKLNKVRPSGKQPLTLTPTPTNGLDVIFIDTVGPLMASPSQNRYILTIVCDLTKWLVSIPVRDKSARTIARALVEGFFLKWGIVRKIVSDFGSEYVNELFAEICKFFNKDHHKASAWHHQSLGVVERPHRTLNEYLRSYLTKANFSEWEKHLAFFTYCYNINKHASNNHTYSPYELLYGKKPIIPHALTNDNLDPVYNYDSYAVEVKHRLQYNNLINKQLIDEYKARTKRWYDNKFSNPIDLEVGEKVLVQKQPYDKHANIYEQATVTSLNKPNVNVKYDTSGRQVSMHMDRVRKIKQTTK